MLNMKMFSWGTAQYSEYIIIVNLTQNTAINALSIIPVIKTATVVLSTPEITISGTAASFNLWMTKPSSGAGITVELLGYDEVSVNDTLVNGEMTAAVENVIMQAVTIALT